VKGAEAPHPVRAASNDVDGGPDCGVYSQMSEAPQGHGRHETPAPDTSQRLIYRVPQLSGGARMT